MTIKSKNLARLPVQPAGLNVESLGWTKRARLLVFLSPELLCAVIKQLLIHLHEKFQSVVDEAVDGPAHTQQAQVIIL